MPLQIPSSASYVRSFDTEIDFLELAQIFCEDFTVDIDIAVFKMEVVDDWCHSKK